MLGIFGKDVVNSISIIATFADEKTPPLYASLEVAQLNINNRYTFNNSALHESQESEFAALFFDMGVESFRKFFNQFEKEETVSLVLTKKVLAECRSLEISAQGLQKQVQEVLIKLDELRQLEQVVQAHRTEIEQNKEFEFEVIEPKLVQIKLPVGIYTTTFLKCNFTCHDCCIYSNDFEKMKCWAVDGNHVNDKAVCCICPTGKYYWSEHVNAPYKLVMEEM